MRWSNVLVSRFVRLETIRPPLSPLFPVKRLARARAGRINADWGINESGEEEEDELRTGNERRNNQIIYQVIVFMSKSPKSTHIHARSPPPPPSSERWDELIEMTGENRTKFDQVHNKLGISVSCIVKRAIESAVHLSFGFSFLPAFSARASVSVCSDCAVFVHG